MCWGCISNGRSWSVSCGQESWNVITSGTQFSVAQAQRCSRHRLESWGEQEEESP